MRMSVMKLKNGETVFYSPIAPTDECVLKVSISCKSTTLRTHHLQHAVYCNGKMLDCGHPNYMILPSRFPEHWIYAKVGGHRAVPPRRDVAYDDHGHIGMEVHISGMSHRVGHGPGGSPR